MASNAPGDCCARGHLIDGQPKGKITTLSDGKTEAYLAEAPADKAKKGHAILYLPDIIGIWNNSKLMVDSFADAGYTTLQPDLFNKDPAPLNPPEGWNVFEWLKPHTAEVVDKIVLEGIKTLKSMGYTKIGAVGYCFGAKYVIRHYNAGVDVGFVAHPSFVTEEELAAITGPLAIAAAETDEIFPTEKRHKSEEILAKTKQPYQVTLYSGTSHGFSVRGDPKVKAVRFAREQAFKQAVDWFNEFLVDDSTSARI